MGIKISYSGKYFPKNPSKYRGNVKKIVWRSSWERKLMKYCDLNTSVLAWSSEEKHCVTPYKSPMDGKWHRYFIDFYMKARNKKGEVIEYLIEVKPKHQLLEPKKQKKVTKKYLNEVATYLTNQAKWAAADKRAKKKGMKFIVMTEDDLGV